MNRILPGAILLLLPACTSVSVMAAKDLGSDRHVCIVQNPRVEVDDFVDVLRDGFSRHSISTEVVAETAAQRCQVTLTYTALRSWDFKPYLSHAELRLWRAGLQIGSAQYHLNGKGGFSLMKWEGTKAKMDPVIDQLLAGQGK